MPIAQSRRRFLTNVASAGAAGLGGVSAFWLGNEPRSFAAEPPPEITAVRFQKDPATCIAPEAAEDLLRAEGFTEIHYVESTDAHARRAVAENSSLLASMIAHGEVDFGRDPAPDHIWAMEAGAPITVLTGLHTGCFEIVGKPDIRSITDLKGRAVGVNSGDPTDQLILKIIVSYVGVDPTRDIHWVMRGFREPIELFVEDKIDAFLISSPFNQEVRARKIGHVILSSVLDLPWSQYHCCMLATSTAFANKYPVATKRVLRAILKAADLCVSDPARIAQSMVDNGLAERYDYALRGLSEVRFDVWREYDPADTLRFYALRMLEAGLIRSTPQKLIAEHTDWRFLNEVKRELKA